MKTFALADEAEFAGQFLFRSPRDHLSKRCASSPGGRSRPAGAAAAAASSRRAGAWRRKGGQQPAIAHECIRRSAQPRRGKSGAAHASRAPGGQGTAVEFVCLPAARFCHAQSDDTINHARSNND